MMLGMQILRVRGKPSPPWHNAYIVNRLLLQRLLLDLHEKRNSSVADLHGQANPETNSSSTFFQSSLAYLMFNCISQAIIDVMKSYQWSKIET